MPTYEYKVVPAPKKGLKAKGARSTEERFANAFATLMNTLGREGWEYLRAETLPCDERSTFGSKSTNYLNMMVFRRLLQDDTIGARVLDVTADAPNPTPKISIDGPTPATPAKLFSATSDDGSSAPELEPIALDKPKED